MGVSASAPGCRSGFTLWVPGRPVCAGGAGLRRLAGELFGDRAKPLREMTSALATVKLYHQDAEILEFSAHVVECRPAGDRWLAVLDQTAFYATAGGQPHDTGSLGGRRVLDVVEDEATGAILHTLDGPVAGLVSGQVDGGRRLDHTEQHTGQHLLSQAFVEVLGAETVSFHLGADAATIDLNTEGLTQEQVDAVEALAFRIIREDRPVRIHWAADAGEAQARFPLRKPPAVHTRVRIVEIDGFDWSACGGTHVASTGRLGLVKVKAWEKYKRGVRVTFLAGGRALRDYQVLDAMTRNVARELTLGVLEIPAAVARHRDEAQRLRRQLKEATDRLLEVEAQELLAAARPVAGARIIKFAFSGRQLEEVKALAARVAAQPRAVALFGTRGALPQLVFARSVDLRLDVGAILKQVLPAIEGRGGGSPVAAQGAGTRGDGLGAALDMAAAKVAEALGV